MSAFLLRLPGLRETVRRCSHFVCTSNFSTLSHALRRTVTLRFVRALFETLAPTGSMSEKDLVAVDSMAVTLPKTQRHHCKKFNNRTVGGGVMWAFRIRLPRGALPVTVLKIMRGAWNDAHQVRDVALAPRGPVYLFDRGFFSLFNIADWLLREVRFILRVRTHPLHWRVIRHVSSPRWMGQNRLELDAMVLIGRRKAKVRPRVRLIVAQLPDGEKLALATDRLEWSAERVLASYGKRWRIEQFHRILKDNLGLAHLYSFHQTGIETLIYTALLLTTLMLMAMTDRSANAETLDLIWQALRCAHEALGITTQWRRNSCIRPRQAKKKTKKRRENH